MAPLNSWRKLSSLAPSESLPSFDRSAPFFAAICFFSAHLRCAVLCPLSFFFRSISTDGFIALVINLIPPALVDGSVHYLTDEPPGSRPAGDLGTGPVLRDMAHSDDRPERVQRHDLDDVSGLRRFDDVAGADVHADVTRVRWIPRPVGAGDQYEV